MTLTNSAFSRLLLHDVMHNAVLETDPMRQNQKQLQTECTLHFAKSLIFPVIKRSKALINKQSQTSLKQKLQKAYLNAETYARLYEAQKK